MPLSFGFIMGTMQAYKGLTSLKPYRLSHLASLNEQPLIKGRPLLGLFGLHVKANKMKEACLLAVQEQEQSPPNTPRITKEKGVAKSFAKQKSLVIANKWNVKTLEPLSPVQSLHMLHILQVSTIHCQFICVTKKCSYRFKKHKCIRSRLKIDMVPFLPKLISNFSWANIVFKHASFSSVYLSSYLVKYGTTWARFDSRTLSCTACLLFFAFPHRSRYEILNTDMVFHM